MVFYRFLTRYCELAVFSDFVFAILRYLSICFCLFVCLFVCFFFAALRCSEPPNVPLSRLGMGHVKSDGWWKKKRVAGGGGGDGGRGGGGGEQKKKIMQHRNEEKEFLKEGPLFCWPTGDLKMFTFPHSLSSA